MMNDFLSVTDNLVYHAQQKRKVNIFVDLSEEVPIKYNWKIPVTCITAPAK